MAFSYYVVSWLRPCLRDIVRSVVRIYTGSTTVDVDPNKWVVEADDMGTASTYNCMTLSGFGLVVLYADLLVFPDANVTYFSLRNSYNIELFQIIPSTLAFPSSGQVVFLPGSFRFAVYFAQLFPTQSASAGYYF